MSPTMPKIYPQQSESKPWYVYIIRCNDNTLYTGITIDPERRLREHNSPGLGARYTRRRQPVILEYLEEAVSRSAACRREYQLKKLRRSQKELLITSASNQLNASV